MAASAGPRGGGTGTILLLFFAMAGTLIAWRFMDRTYPFYAVYSPPENSAPVPRRPNELDRQDAFLRNTVLAYGLFGLALGSFLGTAQGMRHRSLLRSVLALLVVGLIGGVAGGLGGVVAHVLFEGMGRGPDTNVVFQAAIGQGAAWGVSGLGVGFGLGLFSRSKSGLFHAVLGGGIAGMLSGAMHAPLNAVLFAENDVHLRVPSGSVAQLVWLAVPAGLMAIIIGGLEPSRVPDPDLADRPVRGA